LSRAVSEGIGAVAESTWGRYLFHAFRKILISRITGAPVKKAAFTASVLSLAFSALALTGKVVDQSGAPLSGVTVRFVSDGAFVLTGSDGSFTLKPSVPVGAQAVERSPARMRLQDGVLLLANPHYDVMSLRTVDVAGNEIASSSGIFGMEGEVRYSVFGSRPHSPGVYLVQYRMGSTTGTIHVAANKHGMAMGSPSGSGHRSLMRGVAVQAVDSLEFSKAEYGTRRLPLVSDSQDMGAVVLERDFGIPWRAGITYGTLTDERDGQSYRTVVIGTQTWMAQNLNFRNMTGGVDTVGRCHNNSADTCAKYGRLYSWYDVMQGATSSNLSPSGVEGLCPTGWHVPSDLEWAILTSAAGTISLAGRNLSGLGADKYGYRALMGGGYTDVTIKTGISGQWWSATESSSTGAWIRDIPSNPYMYRDAFPKGSSFSARCLKD